MQEKQVQSLGREDPLEEEMATHSSILTWEILWTEEPGKVRSMESQRIGYYLATEHQPPLFVLRGLRESGRHSPGHQRVIPDGQVCQRW